MSMVLTRSPLEPIGMNGAGLPKRRSARLSGDSVEENEPPGKKNKVEGAQTSTVSTKEVDGEAATVSRKKRKGETSPRAGHVRRDELSSLRALLDAPNMLSMCCTAC